MKPYIYSAITIILLTAGLYFFYHVPEVKRAIKETQEKCSKDTDTVYAKGDTVITYRENFITVTKREVIKTGDTLSTSFDSTFISGKDSIILKADVSITNGFADWLVNINHKDAELFRADTLTVYTPKYIETVIKEKDWNFIMWAYITGVVSAIVIFLLAN